jgi:hypothetical protein
VHAARVVAAGLLAAACGTSASKADNVALCTGLRADLQGAALAGTPSREQASATAIRLDPRVTQVADPSLHDAVVRLHQHLHAVDVAWRKRGPDDAARAADRARAAARQAARACHLPEDAFLTS